VSVATDKMDEMRIYMMEIKALDQFETMDTDMLAAVEGGFGWGSIWRGFKCVAGTAGTIGTGALGGSATGGLTLPIIGHVSGGIIGGISGAGVGIASFC
jgi:hypothetical protein